jgi:uncharacterized membrane protein YeaQ/YmgE (transglycosylase-associated protein family)
VMLGLPECASAADLTWPVLVGVATALLAQQAVNQLAKHGDLAWTRGSNLALLAQGACGAGAGAAVCQTLARCACSPALMALCALVGSVLVLDLCQLVRRSRPTAAYLSDSIKST